MAENRDSRVQDGDAARRETAILRFVGKPQCLDRRSGRWRDLPPKGAALLLALAVDHAVSRATLAARLWPDADGDKPRVNLRGLLRDLRGLAGHDLVQGGDTLELADGVEHDLAALNGGVGSIDALPAGELLGTCDLGELEAFRDWLDLVRERWRSAAVRALGDLAAVHEEAGQLAEAVVVAERLLAVAPLDEAAHRLLMRLLALRGDRGAALAAFARCSALLERALGVEPAQPTRALATLIQLGEPLPASPAASRSPTLLLPQRLAGRQAELRSVHGAWLAGRRVLLDGEPGIGKTRLLAELAQQDAGVARVAAIAGDAEVPFSTLARLLLALPPRWRRHWPREACAELARLLPDLGPAPQQPAQAHRLVDALAAVLGACADQGTTRLLVDDLQWADAPSVKLLLAAVDRINAPSVLLAARAGQWPDALAAMPVQQPQRWQLLSLRPLEADGMQALLAAMPLSFADAGAWAGWLGRCTLGNPLHAVETVLALWRAGGDAVFRLAPPHGGDLPAPVSLEHLVAARVARLSVAERQLAQLAALTGAAFTPGLARRLMGLHELELGALWSALEAEGVLHGGTLAHDSLRDALLATLPAEVARELHAHVAEVGAEIGLSAADVARHWWLAQAWPAAALASERAAQQAFALGARDAELRLWDQAAACHDHQARADRAFAARNSAFDAAMAVLPAAAASARAVELEASAHDDSERLDAAIASARVALLLLHFETGLPAAQRAVALAQALPGAATSLRALRARCILAAALAGLRRSGEALALLEGDRAAVTTSSDVRLQLDLQSTLGFVYNWAGRFDESLQAYEAGFGHARALDDPGEAMTMATNYGGMVSRRGDYVRAHELALQAAAYQRRLGQADGVAAGSAKLMLGQFCLRLGHYDEALEVLREAQALLRRAAAQPWLAHSETQIALACIDLGRPDLARQSLGPWPDAETVGRWVRRVVVATIDGLEGDERAAVALAREVLPPAEALTSQLFFELGTSPFLDAPAAIVRCRAAAERAAAAGLLAAQQSAWLREADALRRAGHADEAVVRVGVALQRLEHCRPFDMTPAQAWWIAYQAYESAGRGDDAVAALRNGRHWIREQALPHVPAEYRRSFLELNPVNRGLLATAARCAA